MVRRVLAVAACTLVLAACDRLPNPANRPRELRMDMSPHAVALPDIAVAPTPASQQFSYTHSWTAVMAHGTVAPRFARARDLCLRDRTLLCKLVSANLATSNEELGFESATLEVQLPHGKLDQFERALLAPLNGEAVGDATMQSRSTQAQSVETEAADTARKVSQLTAYRDRLTDIAKRPNLSVDDMIKLEAERARVQSDLDDATGQHRTLTDAIAREDVSITLSERTQSIGQVGAFFRDAGATLADSTISALLFAIGAIPWLPIVAAVIWLVSRLWRWLLQRRTLRVAVARTAPIERTPPTET